MTASIYATRISHVRRAPIRNAFVYRSYNWYVDVDRLPKLPRWLAPLARFSAADHLGDPQQSIRSNVDRFLATRGIDLRGGRITLLTNARVLGHVFNPLSIFWCHDDEGGLRCVLAEVHNTYGERHCYLLTPDEQGRATADKSLYVSPFNDVSGHYEMTLPEPSEQLTVAISLERPGQRPFSATMTGTRRAATAPAILRMAAALPMAPLRVAAQIRWQGVKLWARKLPIQPRPAHEPQEDV